MATVHSGVHTPSTSNASTYASGSFTPTAGDLLVVLVTTTGTTTNTGACTSSVSGLTFSFLQRFQHNSSADQTVAFVANGPATGSSQTVTYDCTGDAATGAIVVVLYVRGMIRFGVRAVRQRAGQANQAASTTPAPAFSTAALTNNPCIGFYGAGTSSSTKNTPPASWTEMYDLTGYSTPTQGIHVISRDSGFTGTTVTWGGTSATAYSSQILEFNVNGIDNVVMPPIVPAGW